MRRTVLGAKCSWDEIPFWGKSRAIAICSCGELFPWLHCHGTKHLHFFCRDVVVGLGTCYQRASCHGPSCYGKNFHGTSCNAANLYEANCHGTSYHEKTCHGTSSHVESCHGTSFRREGCHRTSYNGKNCHGTSYHGASCQIGRWLSWRKMSGNFIPCSYSIFHIFKRTRMEEMCMQVCMHIHTHTLV